MELNFRSVAHSSGLTGEAFSPGDWVISFLHQGPDGMIERLDLLESEVDQYEFQGGIICRWRHKIRSKDESAAEAKKQALLSSEELFLSLYETEADDLKTEDASEAEAVSDSSVESSEAIQATRDLLKFFLALHLERKRVVRSAGKNHVMHIKQKKSYPVPEIEVTDEVIFQLQGQLDQLVL